MLRIFCKVMQPAVVGAWTINYQILKMTKSPLLDWAAFSKRQMAQIMKNLPATWKTWVRSLCWKDQLEGNGNPFHYSCLGNSMDRGAWRATVHGVAKNWTRLLD